MKTIILLLALSTSILTSCEKTENFQLPESDNPVAGNWREIEPAGLGQFEGTTYGALDLREDYTFILSFKKWSDMLRADDPCLGVQDYFAKGTYTISSRSLQLEGCFTDSRHTACEAKCDGQASFMETYEYVFHNDSLILNPDAHPMIRRVLVSR